MTISCESIKYTNHAVEFMARRNITEEEVAACVLNGEIIENYPHDKPYPSTLLLSFVSSRPIHIVLASDEKTKTCFIVTAYEPTLEKFETDYKNKKKINYELPYL